MKIVISKIKLVTTQMELAMHTEFTYKQMARMLEKELLKRNATCKVEVIE